MSSRAEHFRSRGFEALQRAAQTSEDKIRDAFQTVAEGWFELAQHEDGRDKQHKRQHKIIHIISNRSRWQT